MNLKRIIIIMITTTLLLNIFTFNAYANTPIEPVYDIYIHDKDTEEQKPVWVTANSGLNIRRLPGLDGDKISVAPYGSKLIRLKKNVVPDWDLVVYKDTEAYACNKYLTEKKINYYNMGEYRITFYCGCYKCNGKWTGQPTASGKYAEAGVTVATGPEFSFGTKLLIQGHVYTVQDRGVPNGCIDIYLDSHSECNRRGLYYTDIYLIGK